VKHRSWFGNKNFGVLFVALSFAAGLAHAEEKPGTEADDAIRVLVFDSAD
jgi:hypothetical protein